MSTTNWYNTTRNWLRTAAFLMLLPLTLWVMGCDSNGGGMDDDDDDNSNDPFEVALYDTTTHNGQDAIRVQEQDGEGIGYVDADGNEVTEVTWTSDYVYILDGYVWVNEGQTLNIEPGTVIKGEEGQGEDASALIVAQGGTINAEGTADAPIIFTSIQDDLEDPNDLTVTDRGLWGGVIILGRAGLNSSPGYSSVEGIPSDVNRGRYGEDTNGETDDADNSGVLRYVSIRHGGIAIDPNNEINGLTLAGVGSGTTVEYVEVVANLDDCVEWFGGTVNTKYLVGAYCGDDTFDIDEGFRGKGQFWFGIQAADAANRAGEHDGGTDPEDGQPYATPVIYNATLIGTGEDSGNADNELVFKMRDNFAGSYLNSIFTEFPAKGLEIEDLPSGEDSRQRFEDGTLRLENNIWWKIGGNNTFEDIIQLTTDNGEEVDPAFRGTLADYLRDNGNTLDEDPQLGNIARTVDGTLDPVPAADSYAASGAPAADDSFYEAADYYGAFDPNGTNWAAGWAFVFGNR